MLPDEPTRESLDYEQKRVYDAAIGASSCFVGLNYYEVLHVLAVLMSFIVKDATKENYETAFALLRDRCDEAVSEYYRKKNNL